jgi:hypothetical protein
MPTASDLSHLLIALGVAALVCWRLYLPARRFLGRQRLRPTRSWLAAIIFPLVIAALALAVGKAPAQSLAKLAGIAIGVSLAIYGLNHTLFEATPEGLYFTQSKYIGIGLTLLVVGRLVYRAVQGYLASAGFTQLPVGLVKSPLTLFVVGMLAGYQFWYSLGLLRWRRSVGRMDSAPVDPSETQYWFPAKRYGWGWGLPRTWQGWVVLAVFLALVGAGILVFSPRQHSLAFFVYNAVLVALLAAVCYATGEPPRWRWGKK